MGGPDGYLRPVQFLDHLTVIIILKKVKQATNQYGGVLQPPHQLEVLKKLKVLLHRYSSKGHAVRHIWLLSEHCPNAGKMVSEN